MNTTTGSNIARPHAEAFQHAGKVFELVERYQTPPLPCVYAVWFAYVTGSNGELARKLQAMLDRHGKVSAYALGQLYEEFLAECPNEAAQRRLGQSMEQEITDAVALMQAGIDSSDRFSMALGRVEGDLSNVASPDRLHTLISGLVEENARMAAQTRELNDGLKHSQEQIELLNRELSEIEERSMRDPLTGVANRRAFDGRLKAEIARCEEAGGLLCLAFVDIDRFKRINDEFGHLIGDAVLKVVAALIEENARGRDLVARYGGEEFAIILPELSLAQAADFAESLRCDLGKGELRATRSGRTIGSVTASFGVAAFRPGMDAHELIEAADRQLYLAKTNGRNRVEASDALPDDTTDASPGIDDEVRQANGLLIHNQ